MRESTTRSGSNTVSRYHLGFNRREEESRCSNQCTWKEALRPFKFLRYPPINDRIMGDLGTVQEYRQEFAKRSSLESPIGLKEELKAAGECSLWENTDRYLCKTGTPGAGSGGRT
ncbi:hypothetical protein Tco_1315687 [Tanacetum coccineum]